MNEDELAELAARTGKILRWAGFMLGAMLVILVIDLQLKRSVARQAVTASELIARAVNIAGKVASGGRQPVDTPGDYADHGGGHGGDHVDGSPGVAAGSDQAISPDAVLPDAAPAGQDERAPGNGRRTRRAPGGS